MSEQQRYLQQCITGWLRGCPDWSERLLAQSELGLHELAGELRHFGLRSVQTALGRATDRIRSLIQSGPERLRQHSGGCMAEPNHCTDTNWELMLLSLLIWELHRRVTEPRSKAQLMNQLLASLGPVWKRLLPAEQAADIEDAAASCAEPIVDAIELKIATDTDLDFVIAYGWVSIGRQINKIRRTIDEIECSEEEVRLRPEDRLGTRSRHLALAEEEDLCWQIFGFDFVSRLIRSFSSSKLHPATLLCVALGLNYRINRHRAWHTVGSSAEWRLENERFVGGLGALCGSTLPRACIERAIIAGLSREQRETLAMDVSDGLLKIAEVTGCETTQDELLEQVTEELDKVVFNIVLSISSEFVRRVTSGRSILLDPGVPLEPAVATDRLRETAASISSGIAGDAGRAVAAVNDAARSIRTVGDWARCLRA